MQPHIKDITQALQALADPSRIPFAQKNYPTSMKVLGVNNLGIKRILKELKKQNKGLYPNEKIAFAIELVNCGIHECQQLGYEYIGGDKKCLAALTEKTLDDLGQNLDNWVSVDYYAGLLVGYAWRTGIIDINKIKGYLKSKDFWIRRIAVVATVALNQKARGGKGDPKQTLEICEMVIDDHQDLINKALSWALRELAKRDPKPVAEFLDQHRDHLHSRVVREVSNKLETGRKN